jgi:hypothetical protein
VGRDLSWNWFIWGALTMACAVVGFFFLRFWRESRDRFFLLFAAAFWALGLNWLGLVALPYDVETRHYVYFFRLAAFVLILVAIVDKNRRQ